MVPTTPISRYCLVDPLETYGQALILDIHYKVTGFISVLLSYHLGC